jgi:molybdate transport system ATP-binding protein
VLRHDEAGGVTILDLGGVELAAPLTEAAIGSRIGVGIYADEVMLCLTKPAGLSARNALPCSVTHVDTMGREVLLRIAVGSGELLVRITPSAASELNLSVGSSAVAVIKTAACHLLG